MKNFFAEFKKFITRGNVVDMAVGVLVGSSFTAIVNGLSNFILKPIINWLLAIIFGANSLSELFTFLKKVEVSKDILNEAGEVIGTEMVPDLTQSIYIDWGSFINAIINFFLIALVLFTIVKIINKVFNLFSDPITYNDFTALDKIVIFQQITIHVIRIPPAALIAHPARWFRSG